MPILCYMNLLHLIQIIVQLANFHITFQELLLILVSFTSLLASKEFTILQHKYNYITMNNRLRNNYDQIDAWAYDDEQDKDTLTLTNLIKRKATLSTLPQIIDAKSKLPKKHFKKISNLELAQAKKQQNHPPPLTYKAARQKTQGFSNHTHYTHSNRKRQQIETIPEEPISPPLVNLRMLEQPSLVKKVVKQPTIIKSSSCEAVKLSKHCRTQWPDLQRLNIFTTHQSKAEGRYSESINKNKQNLLMKKSKSKLYVRLNTLEMVHDLQRQIDYEFTRGKNSKHAMSKESLTQKRGVTEPSFLKKQKVKSNMKLQQAVLKKMNERFKQTFIKQDIFNRKKVKLQKMGKKVQAQHEFNDKIIFLNNSIYSKLEDNGSLHSKIQIIKHLHRYQVTQN